MAESLLPSVSEPRETAVSLTSAERRPLDSDIIRRFYDPWACPAHLLPYLAFQMSVDLWNEAWTESKKRSVIARAPEMHRLKGSIEGLRQYIEVAGGELVHYLAPPQGVFCDVEDPEQRAAWLARFAQLRIFTHRLREIDPEQNYCEEAFAGGDDDDGFYAAAPEDFLFGGRSGVMWDHGVETPLRRQEVAFRKDGVQHFVETYGAVTSEDAFFADCSFEGDYLDPMAATPTLRLTLTPITYHIVETQITGDFIDRVPEIVRETVDDPAGFYADISCEGDYVEDGIDPATLVYQLWRLYDKARSGGLPANGASFYDDPTLLGLDAFTLLLDIEVPDSLPPQTFCAGGFEGDFLEEHDSSKTDFVLDAVRQARADRDTVLVRFATRRVLKFSDRPKLPFRLGQIVKDY
jgi:phage tail-like protein